MIGKKFLIILLFFCLIGSGCAGKNIKLAGDDPVRKAKSDFLSKYGFFMTEKEMLSGYPDLSKPIRSFGQIDSLDELGRFTEYFWVLRDTDPFTEINEYKSIVDGRISDVENEIFAQDSDIPGTRFDANGGLQGDLARVYLLHGSPSFRAKLKKLTENSNLSDLMVWYYVDNRDRHLMRFLFYEKYGRFRVFKSYGGGTLSLDFVLRELSRHPFPSDEEINEIWEELNLLDVDWIFRAAMMEFSSFPDIVIEGGGKGKLGALNPPDPAGLAAVKPSVFGQPEDVGTRSFVYGRFNSFIPAYFRIVKNSQAKANKFSFSMILNFSNLDWELKEDKAESELELRISFQNIATKRLNEFFTRMSVITPKNSLEEKFETHFFTSLDERLNMPEKDKPETLGQLIGGLEPGYYIVNVYLRHAVTKKYNAWREEITIE